MKMCAGNALLAHGHHLGQPAEDVSAEHRTCWRHWPAWDFFINLSATDHLPRWVLPEPLQMGGGPPSRIWGSRVLTDFFPPQSLILGSAIPQT